MPHKTKRIVLVDHHDNPPDDRVSSHLERRGFELARRWPVNGDDLGDDDIAGAVIYGGTHNVDEAGEYPFLNDEMDWIRRCHARGVPLLGICLGAQLIAAAFGAKVTPMARGRCEFGYYRVTPTCAAGAWMPSPLMVAQAHFYEFALPAGATLLARGDACANQAFCHGEHTFAVQFHPEVTMQIFARWQQADWAKLFYAADGAQSVDEQTALAEKFDAAQHDWFVGFLDRLFAG